MTASEGEKMNSAICGLKFMNHPGFQGTGAKNETEIRHHG